MDASASAIAASSAQFRTQSAYADALKLAAGKIAQNNGAQNQQSPDKVKQAAQSFEAFFVGQMMEYMSAGIKADSTFGGGQAEDTWRSMLNQEYGKQIAQSGKLGISNTVMQGMLQAQEKRSRKSGAQSTDAPSTDDTSTADANSDNTQAAATAAGSLARGKSVMA